MSRSIHDADAEFELREIAAQPDLNAIVIQGSVRRGANILSQVRRARVLAFSSLYIGAPIRTVEIEGQMGILTLDVPDPEIQYEWLVICEPGVKVLVDL